MYSHKCLTYRLSELCDYIGLCSKGHMREEEKENKSADSRCGCFTITTIRWDSYLRTK